MAIDKRKITTLITQQCCLLVLISSLVSGVKFGLLSPIEVVEEWGCQDSEIRLTCSSLDSTIAILEATFKPNCSLSSRKSSGENASDNCVQIDLKRLTPVNLSPRTDPLLNETIAGRRFLDALRKNHKKIDESTPAVETVKAASFNFDSKPKEDANELKRKRMNLRASLEELLVEYLHGLAPDEAAADRSRVKRSPIDRMTQNSDAEIVNKSKRREENHNNYSGESVKESIRVDDTANATRNASKSVCAERRQRITQLDRNELSAVFNHDSDKEHNIRRMLNYRCSGKNHCSFVFNVDHPISELWPYGTVHIKYICMERYRLNKFCGEHLLVVNESPEPEPDYPPRQRSADNDITRTSDNSVERDGPIAEALIQNEQMFHHLKILKPSPSEMENERRTNPSIEEKLEKPITRKGVYSQDFHKIKVLRANLDDFNDIEKIADEFYFKKENELENDDNGVHENTVQTKPYTEPTPSIYASRAGEHSSTKSGVETTFDSSNNGLRDARSTLGYDEVHNPKYHSSPVIPTAETDTHMHQTTANLWQNELLPPNTNIFETLPIDDGNDLFSENQTNAKIVHVESEFSVIKTNRADIDKELESGEEYDSSDEDYAVEVDGPRVWRKNKIRAHTSYQKTALRQPLLQQGFIASPGYPKYYVGNSNCSWRVTVPSGQRVRLILLDVNLRYDAPCKDFLQIVDVGGKILLYKNCTEIIKPLEISSESNELQITIRANSALAYPKRGILIYYTAHGCILPTAPNNGRVIEKTDDFVKFLCDPSFVFPDTIQSSRTLFCTDRNTWDSSLPNCIEHSTVKIKKDDPHIQSLWKQNRIGVFRKPDETDFVFDILIPLMIIVGILVINGFILLIIWHYRKKRKNQQTSEALAQL